jgi:hypothetical protein
MERRRLTLAGMQIETSDEQPQNAASPITVSLEPDSNINSDREEQSRKLESPRISTLAGMQIDLSDEQLKKPRSSIRDNLEPASNSTVNRCVQFAKQKMPIASKSHPTNTLLEWLKYRTNVIPFDAIRKPPETK